MQEFADMFIGTVDSDYSENAHMLARQGAGWNIPCVTSDDSR